MNNFVKAFKKRFFKNSKFLYIELLIVIVIISTFAISIFTTIIHTETTNSHLEKQAESINKEIIETLDEVSQLLKNTADHFVAQNPKTDKEIAQFLLYQSKTIEQVNENYKLHNLFTLPQFDWQKQQYTISLNPYDRNQYKLIEYKRTLASMVNELQICEALPWVMHTFSPRIGFSSGYWCFPAALGVTNEHGNFLGAIAIGISLTTLAEKIQRCLENNYYFIIIDKNFRPVLQSTTMEHPIDQKSEYNTAIFKNKSDFDKNEGELAHPIHYKDIIYSYYRKIDGYEYTILVGFDKKHAWQEFLLLVFPRILEFVGMGIFCLLLLYLSRRRMIKLSRESDQAKSKFLHSLNQGINQPLQSILAHSEVLLKYFKKEVQINISNTNIIELLQTIYSEASNIRNLTTTQLNFQKVDVNQIIEECIILRAKEALFNGITIESQLEENLPYLTGDPLRIKQIILSLTKIALNYTPKGGVVNITTSWDKFHDELIITIVDNGFGLSLQEMERIGNQFKEADDISGLNGDLDLEDTKKLIQLHNGFCSFKSIPYKGNEILVRFRYQLIPPPLATEPKPKSNIYPFVQHLKKRK